MERKTNNEYQNDTARQDNTRVVIQNRVIKIIFLSMEVKYENQIEN